MVSVYSTGVVMNPTSYSRAQRLPAAVAFRVNDVPVVAMSEALPPVCGLVLHAVPFQTPRLNPRIWDVFGDRLLIATVTAPSVVMVKMWVNEPFCDNVPVNASVCGFAGVVLAAASCDSVLSEHAAEASAAPRSAAIPTILNDTFARASSDDMVCIP